MTFRSTWWYPNYVEYGAGISQQKTWPQVMEQYRRPDAIRDLRYYDLPVHQSDMLYYHKPRYLMPEYRATIRDKPHTVARHYPDVDPSVKPKGFHGRQYYEDSRLFKYEGATKDDLYWLEREPFLPQITHPHRYSASKRDNECRLNRNMTYQKT